MESYFRKYKPFLVFLSKFLLTYLALIFLYQRYLRQYDAARFEIDGITRMVANNSKSLLQVFNFDVVLYPHVKEASFKVFIEGHYLLRIIEGCNAVSVMILFVAFVVAFSGKFLQTFIYILSGIVLIHILNVLRIALLSIGLLYHPEYENLLHDIIFPLFIYGVVFILWVIWVNKFSFYAKKNPGS